MTKTSDAWAYCDTSALAKRYLREPGRTALARWLAHRRVVSSVLLPLELGSALARRVRDGALTTIALPTLFEKIGDDRRYWTLMELTAEVERQAAGLLETHPLRTAEAIHIASARIFQLRMRVPVVFASADARQLAAAAQEGLPVWKAP